MLTQMSFLSVTPDGFRITIEPNVDLYPEWQLIRFDIESGYLEEAKTWFLTAANNVDALIAKRNADRNL